MLLERSIPLELLINIKKIHRHFKEASLIFGPASVSYKIGVVGNNWLVGWLVTQFSQKRL